MQPVGGILVMRRELLHKVVTTWTYEMEDFRIQWLMVKLYAHALQYPIPV